MTEDAVVKLILQITGQQEVRDMRKAHDDLRQSILEAARAHRTLDEALKDPAIQKATADLKAMEAELVRMEKAIDGVGRSGGLGGRSMIEFSRALQDFQAAGFAGIANNMEGLAASIGAPAFVAGLATLAGTFGPQLVAGIADFVTGLFPAVEQLNQGADAAERLKDRIKELSEKPVKLAVDLLELDAANAKLREMEANAAAYQQMRTGRSKTELESGTAVKGVFAELAPGEQGRITDELERQAFNQRVSQDTSIQDWEKQATALDADVATYRKLPGGMGDDTADAFEKRARQIRDQIAVRRLKLEKEAREDVVGKAFRQATEGDATGNEDLARQLEGAGYGDLANQVRERAPSNIGAFQDEQERLKQQKREAEQQLKQRQREDEQKARQAELDRKQQERQAELERKQQERDRDRMIDWGIDRAREEAEAQEQGTGGLVRDVLGDRNLRSQIASSLLGGSPSARVGPALGQFLERSGLVPRGQGGTVGAAAAVEVRDDLNRQIAGLQARGFSQTEAVSMLQAEMLEELMKLGQQVNRVEQIIRGNQASMRQMRHTAMQRGRR